MLDLILPCKPQSPTFVTFFVTFYNQSLFYISTRYYPQKDSDFMEEAGPTSLPLTQATLEPQTPEHNKELDFFQENLSRI